MSVIAIPRPLLEKLGDEATDALVQVVKQLDESRKEELVTKGDISDLKAEIKDLELRIEKRFSDTIKWVAAMLVAQAAAIAALVKLL